MVRQFFMVAAVLVVSCSSSSEFEIKESEVPPNVMKAFKAKYPLAKEVKWEAEKEDDKFYFEAEFKDGGKEKEIHISPDGSSILEGD